MFKAQIINVRELGQRCGYGEGETWVEALADALRLAHSEYPGKVLPFDGHCVEVELSTIL